VIVLINRRAKAL